MCDLGRVFGLVAGRGRAVWVCQSRQGCFKAVVGLRESEPSWVCQSRHGSVRVVVTLAEPSGVCQSHPQFHRANTNRKLEPFSIYLRTVLAC